MNKKRVLTNAIIIIVFGLAIYGVGLLEPIIVEKPDIIEACTHEVMQSDISGELLVIFSPVLLFVKGKQINEIIRLDYCNKCYIMFVIDDDTYTYTELFDKVAP